VENEFVVVVLHVEPKWNFVYSITVYSKVTSSQLWWFYCSKSNIVLYSYK